MDSKSFVRRFRLAEWVILLAVVFGLITFSVAGEEVNEPLWGPYLTLKSGSTIAVNWKSRQRNAGSLVYDRADYYLDHEELRQSAEVSKGERRFNHVLLEELTPGTEYVYRIGKNSGGSGVNYFGSPKVDSTDFSFFAYGDSRTCPRKHRLVASEMALDSFDPSFIIHTGDFVEVPATENWADFFWAIEPFSKSTPLVPSLGNHERNHDSYYNAFELPQGGGDYDKQWYSFSHGNVKFIVLDSNVDQNGLSKEREWLVDELKTNTRPATVVTFHHPIYSSVYPGEVNDRLADNWGSLFEKYGVELVFNGHVHAYERLVKNGVTYVVTGGGGAPTDNLIPRFDFSRKTKGDSLHYVRASVNEEEIRLQTIEVAQPNRSETGGRVGCTADMKKNRKVIDEAVIDIN